MALGVSLACSLAVLRAYIVMANGSGGGLLAELVRVLTATAPDLAYAASITLVMAGFSLLSGGRFWSRLLYALFIVLVLVSVIGAWMNIPAVRMIGKPFTYSWLVYADFFRSHDAQAALAANCRPMALVLVAAQIAAMLGLAVLFRRGLNRLARYPRARVWVGAAIVVLFGAYFPWAFACAKQCNLPDGQTSNPVVVFFASIAESHRLPPIFTIQPAFQPDDVRIAAERTGSQLPAVPTCLSGQPGRIRNVVLFVLESVAAEYTDPYGASYGATPHLAACRSHALRFENAYAHRPSTPSSLVSLLCSIYPPANRESITTDYRAVSLESLSGRLKRRGFATGFFGSGDWKYARMNEFLSKRSFDLVEDCHDRRGHLLVDTSEDDPVARTDDVHTVESMERWIRRVGQQPFFAMVWTDMTHYPYCIHGKEQPMVSRANVPGQMLNRYLNALRRSDEALGRLIQALQEQGLSDSTLVIVVGDHGEAFARHGTYGHASGLYEENVHVPLVFIHPALFRGDSNGTVCGMVDIAPTVLHLLGEPEPAYWQGKSLFDSERAGRVYFQCPYSEYLFGYREGSRTFLYNGSTGTQEIYDVAADPHQSRNLMGDHPDLGPVMLNRLAAWVQYQVRLMATLAGGSAAESQAAQPRVK